MAKNICCIEVKNTHVAKIVEGYFIRDQIVSCTVKIAKVIKKLKPKSDKEIIELNNFAKKNLPLYKNLKKIEYFDVSYVANKMKDKKYTDRRQTTGKKQSPERKPATGKKADG